MSEFLFEDVDNHFLIKEEPEEQLPTELLIPDVSIKTEYSPVQKIIKDEIIKTEENFIQK